MAGTTGAAATDDDHVIELADADGTAIAYLVWRPKRPGGTIILSVVPFVAVALVAFALLIVFIMRHMRRTAAAIAAGERQLRHLAMHDPVCGLPNRIYFSERLERAIAEVRNGGPTAAVFYIDLDNFKDVNDTLGHHIGDELILNVTRRLSQIMRDDDLVARLGGDEFAIIMTCASDSYSLQAVAERILAAICAPFVVSGHGINIGASIGIAVIDSCTQDARDILRYADMAPIAPRTRAATAPASTTRRWTPTCRIANCSKARSARRSKTGSCTSSISRSSIRAATGCSAWKHWRAGSTRYKAKSRRRALFRSPNIRASLSSLANTSCAAPASTAAIGRA
jgi:diguanylate cyclase (GGDEF)-like protein